MEIIHGCTLVHLNIRRWSGRAQAQRDIDVRLGQGGHCLPPELMELGTKKVFPPKALDVFETLRKSAERVVLRKGTRFLGGYCLPDSVVDEVTPELDTLKAQYAYERESFMAGFDARLQEWLSEQANYAGSFQQEWDRSAIEKKFVFGYQTYKVEPLSGVDSEEIADQVLHELGVLCRDASRALLNRKQRVSGESLKKKLQPMLDKLHAMSFGNGRLLSVLNEFEVLRDAIPKGYFDKDDLMFSNMVSFFSVCSCEDRLQAVIDGDFSVSELLNPVPVLAPEGLPVPTPVPRPAVSAYF